MKLWIWKSRYIDPVWLSKIPYSVERSLSQIPGEELWEGGYFKQAIWKTNSHWISIMVSVLKLSTSKAPRSQAETEVRKGVIPYI